MALPQLAQLVALLAVHWVADFVLQSRWMAVNEGERIDALVIHVASYTLALLVGSALIFGVRPIAPLLLVRWCKWPSPPRHRLRDKSDHVKTLAAGA
jgi:hypothetical protein